MIGVPAGIREPSSSEFLADCVTQAGESEILSPPERTRSVRAGIVLRSHFVLGNKNRLPRNQNLK